MILENRLPEGHKWILLGNLPANTDDAKKQRDHRGQSQLLQRELYRLQQGGPDRRQFRNHSGTSIGLSVGHVDGDIEPRHIGAGRDIHGESQVGDTGRVIRSQPFADIVGAHAHPGIGTSIIGGFATQQLDPDQAFL